MSRVNDLLPLDDDVPLVDHAGHKESSSKGRESEQTQLIQSLQQTAVIIGLFSHTQTTV
jgi:hypothetical protein